MRALHVVMVGLLLGFAAMQSVEARNLARPGHPLGSPGDWISPDDYPANALRQMVDGITQFRLSYGVDGRPTSCLVLASSGSVTLDQTACALLMARARFEPARDSRGRPAPGTYENRVRWQIPAEQKHLPQIDHFSVVVDVSDQGLVENCAAAGEAAGDQGPCSAFPAGRQMPKRFDAAGVPVKYRVTTTVTQEFRAR